MYQFLYDADNFLSSCDTIRFRGRFFIYVGWLANQLLSYIMYRLIKLIQNAKAHRDL
jgi:hypothetical protein